MNKCYECGRECTHVICVECLEKLEKYLAEAQAERDLAEFACPDCGSLLGVCYSGCPQS